MPKLLQRKLIVYLSISAGKAIDNYGSRVTTTGLSRDTLQDAIKAGQLPSKMMGKAHRIKTQDLEQYIANLDF